MDINRIDFENFFAQGDDYWRHVGIAEDVIKKGAMMGLIPDDKAKRAIRLIDSQASTPGGGQTLFAADMLAAPYVMENPQDFKKWFNTLMAKGDKEQKGANAIPRMHGHHPNSLSSVAAAGQQHPITNHGKMIMEIDAAGDVIIGTNAENMIGLMEGSHLTNREFNAHSDPLKDGVTNTGYWQTGQSYADVEDPIRRAHLAMDETLRPQQAMSMAAYYSPENQEAIATAADALGLTPEQLMDTAKNARGKTQANINRDLLNKEEFDSKGLNNLLYMDGGRARNDTTSNKGVLDERKEANINRAGMGLSGNEEWVMDGNGRLTLGLRSNNPRRRR